MRPYPLLLASAALQSTNVVSSHEIFFLCRETAYPYSKRQSERQEMPLVGGFECLELCLYAIRELA